MALSTDFNPIVAYDLTATIASGQTVSGAVDLMGGSLVGIFLPSTFDGTTLTFQAASSAGGTYVAVEDGAGSPASITLTATAASKYIALSGAIQQQLRGLRFIKLAAGTSQSTTDTVLTLAVRPI